MPSRYLAATSMQSVECLAVPLLRRWRSMTHLPTRGQPSPPCRAPVTRLPLLRSTARSTRLAEKFTRTLTLFTSPQQRRMILQRMRGQPSPPYRPAGRAPPLRRTAARSMCSVVARSPAKAPPTSPWSRHTTRPQTRGRRLPPCRPPVVTSLPRHTATRSMCSVGGIRPPSPRWKCMTRARTLGRAPRRCRPPGAPPRPPFLAAHSTRSVA